MQPPQHVEPPGERGVVQRLPPVAVGRRHARAVRRAHEPLGKLEVAGVGGEMHRLLPALVLRTQVRPLVPRDEARQLRLAGVGRRVHRLPAVVRRRGDVGARLEEPLGGAVVAVGARVVERLPAVIVARAHVAARLREQLRHVHLAGRRGRVERRRAFRVLEGPEVWHLAQQAVHLDQ
eukprot:1092960-Prymnesium_polylepis.1